MEAVAALWDAAAQHEHARSRTTDTAVVRLPDGHRIVRKRWRWPGVRERLKGIGRTTALARSPARREHDALAAEPSLELHPAPLAWVEWRSGGLLVRCMLLLTELPGAVDLASWLRDASDAQHRRRVLDDLARRVAALHGAGLIDGDMHPRNVLVDAAVERVFKVDCARQRRFAEAPLRRTTYDLGCLDVGLGRFASRAERLRALRAYANVRASAGRTCPDKGDMRELVQRVEAWRRRLAPTEEHRLPSPTSN